MPRRRGVNGLAWDLSCETDILRRVRRQGKIVFPAQLTTSRVGSHNNARLIPKLMDVMTINVKMPRQQTNCWTQLARALALSSAEKTNKRKGPACWDSNSQIPGDKRVHYSMYVCMVITYSRVWINRVRLPILLVRDSSRVPRRRSFMKPPYAIGLVPSLSGHAIAYRWRSLPRVRRHRASKPQGSSERVLPWQITMDQLIFASLSHTHYWYEVGMLKVPAVSRLTYFTTRERVLERRVLLPGFTGYCVGKRRRASMWVSSKSQSVTQGVSRDPSNSFAIANADILPVIVLQ